jgi:hypothetical protein
MRSLIVAALLATSMVSVAAVAETTSAAQAPYSTAETDLGTLLDDPAARAVLDKHIPKITGSGQIDMARSMTLKGLQQYAPDLTDTVLAAIDVDLAKLAKKK